MGLGQKARLGAGRLSSRPRDTPEKPGEEWSPSCSVKRGGGTEEPRVVLSAEQVSTGDGTVVGFPKKPKSLGKPADMLTWGR